MTHEELAGAAGQGGGRRPPFFRRAHVLALLTDHLADSRLSRDLDELAGDRTDDLDPLRRSPA